MLDYSFLLYFGQGGLVVTPIKSFYNHMSPSYWSYRVPMSLEFERKASGTERRDRWLLRILVACDTGKV